MIVIVRQSVITASPDENSKLSLAPHGPFSLLACAPASLVATAPPGLSDAGRAPTSRLSGKRSGRLQAPEDKEQEPRVGVVAGEAGALGRGRRAAFDRHADRGAALTEQNSPATVRSGLGEGGGRAWKRGWQGAFICSDRHNEP